VPINHSPLRYPGGKAALAPFLGELIRLNDMGMVSYVEPYCGGAGAALDLLFNRKVRNIYLNDLDPAIYSLWNAMVNNSDALCAVISDTPVTIDVWHEQQEYYRGENEIGLELAFATLFLNRTNRSGIIAAGPIGGKNQTGKWLIDARYNKDSLIKKIQRISWEADNIMISNLDAIDFLRDVINPLNTSALVYLDPPYYVQGQSLYTNHYSHNDHEAISGFVQNELNKPWVVSYDRHPEIERLYNTCERMDYGIRYSAQARYFGRELLVISDDLTLDGISDPLSVGRAKAQQVARQNDLARRAVHYASK